MASRSAIYSGVVSVAALTGKEIHCIGSRAHQVEFDFVGDSLATLSDAYVSMKPMPDSNHCAGGDKAICVGSNVDESCSKAVNDVPIDDVFDCQSCFLGAGTDLYYTLNISGFGLKGVEVGLKGSRVRGAVEVHGQKSASGPVSQGTINLIDSSKVAKIAFKVAKLIPVDITIGLPTSFEYSLGWKGALDAVAGADLDIDLGDHFITWTKELGFVTHNTSSQVTATPVLAWNSGEVGADVQLKLHSSLQVDINKVITYHVNMTPSLPTVVELEHSIGQKDQLCATSDVDFHVDHEADVHFSLFGKKEPIYHFGPNDLYNYHKEEQLKKCVGIRSETTIV